MKRNMKTCQPLAVKAYITINQRRMTLARDRDLTLRQICGKANWDRLNDGTRRWIGKFVSAAVRMGLFELEQTKRDSGNSWRYRRR